jgi:hypothetical protein
LTIGLATLKYLFSEVSFSVSTILANNVYKHSLEAVVTKEISWFLKTHSSILANKYNKDYDLVFISIQELFKIVELAVIFIATLITIDIMARTLFILTTITFFLYYSLFKYFSRV